MIRAARLLCASLLAVAAVPAAATAAPVGLVTLGGPGSGAGQLSSPHDVSVDPVTGNVSVADTANNRISQFTPSGTFIRAFGFDVIPGGGTGLEACTAATTCKAGTAGGAGGELGAPYGIAQNAQGNIFVTQVNDARVSNFRPTGGFIATLGFDVDAVIGGGELEVCAFECQTGVPGSQPGQLDQPTGIDTDPLGRIYVANRGSGLIHLFSPIDLYTGTFGDPGAAGAAGVLDSPEGVDLDGTNLWVADTGNSRLARFSTGSGGEPTAFEAYGWNVDPADPPGSFGVCSAPTGGCQAGTPGTGLGQFDQPSGVAFTSDGKIAIADSANASINRLSVARLPLDSFGPVSAPSAIEADCRGALWVAEPGVAQVRRFGETGTLAPPCTPPTPPPVDPGPDPDLTYRILRIVRHARAGTARLYLRVSARTSVELKSRSVVHTRRVGGPGTVIVPVRARGAAKRALSRTGRARVRIALYLDPVGGNSSYSFGRSFTLVKRRPRHKRA